MIFTKYVKYTKVYQNIQNMESNFYDTYSKDIISESINNIIEHITNRLNNQNIFLYSLEKYNNYNDYKDCKDCNYKCQLYSQEDFDFLVIDFFIFKTIDKYCCEITRKFGDSLLFSKLKNYIITGNFVKGIDLSKVFPNCEEKTLESTNYTFEQIKLFKNSEKHLVHLLKYLLILKNRYNSINFLEEQVNILESIHKNTKDIIILFYIKKLINLEINTLDIEDKIFDLTFITSLF
jgi:hypothetical protein